MILKKILTIKPDTVNLITHKTVIFKVSLLAHNVYF